MLELIVVGRGGQGAQTAGNMLARTFFELGEHVQSFASYGGARRGTPVFSFIRVDDRPIRLRCNIEKPHALLCFDDSLLTPPILAMTTAETLLVVNSEQPQEAFAEVGECRVLPVDGFTIAHRNGMGRIVNSALLGAVAAAIDAPPIDALARVIEATAPVKQSENVRACREGYATLRGLLEPKESAA